MSSIRPLATITVLAFVGVFLYLKINETEPPLPEGVEDWSADTALQFDMGGDDPAAPPQFGVSSAAPAGSEAPAFASAETAPAFNPTVPQTNTSSSNVVAAPAETAPSFSNANSAAPPINTAPSFEAVKTNAAQAVSSALPELPAMPSLPSVPAEAPIQNSFQTSAPSSSKVSLADRVAGVVAGTGVVEAATAKAQAALPGVAIAPATSNPETETLASLSLPAFPTDNSLSNNSPNNNSTANNSLRTQPTSFAATRLAVQAALDRGELSQALLLLSDWHGDPSLTPSEASEVHTLLGQLAGSVIYSTEHRLEPPYMVQAGEQLETIAKKFDVPWQLLAKINGIGSADQLQPGQQLKVMRGPFSAHIDISQRKMTLMLDRRYAGRFSLEMDSRVSIEEGHWAVNQKLLTPANVSLPGSGPTAPNEERSLMLSSTNGAVTQVAILRGATTANPLGTTTGREMRMNPTDAKDVFDILSLGSKVVIRR